MVAYLAQKAGWDITLVDRRKNPPASGLAKTLTADPVKLDRYGLAVMCSGFDFIVPAFDERKLLERLYEARSRDLIPPLAFDLASYRQISSKVLAKKLFRRLKLSTPRDFYHSEYAGLVAKNPDLARQGPRFVAKPIDGTPRARGVRLFNDYQELLRAYPRPEDLVDTIVEEWVDGPVYSVEVTAVNGEAKSHQVTSLGMDDDNDCYKVTAPSGLFRGTDKKLGEVAELLARTLNLTGLFRLKAIYRRGKFYLLGIDPLFPSQTPIALYWSTGVNLLVELAACFMELPPGTPRPVKPEKPKKVMIERFLMASGRRFPQGGRALSSLGPVSVMPGFMGSIEALVAGDPNGSHHAAGLINVL
jgi:pyrrolysine biosynthesis protein PylC